MTPAALIILLIIIVYTIQTSLWLYQWKKLPIFQPSRYAYVPVSVVIAFRNEAHNMIQLIKNLNDQRYPSHLFEVILVDDHSGDHSSETAREAISGLNNFRCIQNTSKPGKKGALITGIAAARNELIVTTDADTYQSPLWLAMISTFYSIHKPALIIAPVNINSGSRFAQRFFAADFISMMAAGAGSAAAGRPVYCNGANMAFGKSAFMRHNDAMNSSTASGDDTFLLHAMKKSKEKILFLKSPKALTEVKVPDTTGDFMQQHIRWASKSRYYRDPHILITAGIVFLAGISVLYAFILLLTGKNLWLFAILFLLKGVADYRLLMEFCSYLDRKIKPGDFILFSLIYPVYLVVTALAGLFSGYTWKGRRY